MLTIRKPEQKTSGFRMFPVFKWSDFGSLLIFIFIFFLICFIKIGFGWLVFYNSSFIELGHAEFYNVSLQSILIQLTNWLGNHSSLGQTI